MRDWAAEYENAKKKWGVGLPYDATPGGNRVAKSQPNDWAAHAARRVIANLSDRSGIKHEIQNSDITTGVRKEIIKTLAKIIRDSNDSAEKIASAKQDTLNAVRVWMMKQVGELATEATEKHEGDKEAWVACMTIAAGIQALVERLKNGEV